MPEFRTSRPGIISHEIEGISLHNPIPIQARIYGLPFLSMSHGAFIPRPALSSVLTCDSTLSFIRIHLLCPIRRLGSLGRMDIHLLRLVICRSRLDFPIDSMEHGYQPACGLHHCELSSPPGAGCELTF